MAAVFITYDLAFEDDIEGFYTWLDSLNAKDIGGNTVHIDFSFSKDVPNVESDSSIFDAIKDSMLAFFTPSSKTRIYVLSHVNLKGKRTLAGKFLAGSRKKEPWRGYYHRADDTRLEVLESHEERPA